MKTVKFFPYVLLIGLLLALAGSAGPGLAQGPEPPEGNVQPQGGVSIAATVNSKFSYQGVLKENGNPVTGSRDMTFRLYSDNTCSTQVGGTILIVGVQVTDGLFSVDLDVSQSVFNGQGLWLEVEVEGTKIGCQEILAVPYALSLRPGATVNGSSSTILTLAGGATALNATGSYFGVYGWADAASGTTYGVWGMSDSTAGRGVAGYAFAGSGVTYGVYGQSASTDGRGVEGLATATSGTTYGVYGKSNSPSGYGVYGTSPNIGVYGESNDTSGLGVFGYVGAPSGTTYGVYGQSASTAGRGVAGYASAASGTTYGVYGEAQSPDGYGGYFKNTATSGNASGVYGEVASTSGTGVVGEATSTSSNTFGVRGINRSSDGIGVYGWAGSDTSGTDGRPYGVMGYSNKGHGVYGETLGDWGNISGVYGEAVHDHANGVNGVNTAGGYGVRAESNTGVALAAKSASGNIIEAWDTNPENLRWYVSNAGEVYADGSFHGGGADFAEMLPAAEGLEPGDVLVIGPDGHLLRSSSPYDTSVIGVYSTEPGFVGGSDEEMKNPGKVPVAVVGVVPVKASAENGPIVPGDLLVASSTPGHAMRAGPNPPVGTVIGKALEGLDEGTGVIQMLVMLQ